MRNQEKTENRKKCWEIFAMLMALSHGFFLSMFLIMFVFFPFFLESKLPPKSVEELSSLTLFIVLIMQMGSTFVVYYFFYIRLKYIILKFSKLNEEKYFEKFTKISMGGYIIFIIFSILYLNL